MFHIRLSPELRRSDVNLTFDSFGGNPFQGCLTRAVNDYCMVTDIQLLSTGLFPLVSRTLWLACRVQLSTLNAHRYSFDGNTPTPLNILKAFNQ
jgi:hypothetical protein